MDAFAKTDVGLKREMNQDYVYSNTEHVGALPNLFIVADGMGGHNAGDFASRFCVEEFVKNVSISKERTLISSIDQALVKTNEDLIKAANGRPELEGMGTTFVAAVVVEDTMYVANIGDSRLYMLRNELEQITEDHSLVAEMVRSGDLDKEEARFHPKKNVVTRAISANGVTQADFFEIKVMPGDTILLCSDGLSNMVGEEELKSIMKQNSDNLEVMGDELIDAANRNGGRDNISVVLVRV